MIKFLGALDDKGTVKMSNGRKVQILRPVLYQDGSLWGFIVQVKDSTPTLALTDLHEDFCPVIISTHKEDIFIRFGYRPLLKGGDKK